MTWFVAVSIVLAAILVLLFVLDIAVRVRERKHAQDPRTWLFGMTESITERRWRTAWEIRHWYYYTHEMWDGTFFGFRFYRQWRSLKLMPGRRNVRLYAYFFSSLVYDDVKYLLKHTKYIKRRDVYPRNRLLYRIVRWMFRNTPEKAKPHLEWARPIFLRQVYCLTKEGAEWVLDQEKKENRTPLLIEGKKAIYLNE